MTARPAAGPVGSGGGGGRRSRSRTVAGAVIKGGYNGVYASATGVLTFTNAGTIESTGSRNNSAAAGFITCGHLETDTSGGIISFQIKDSCTPLQALKKKN